MRPLCFQRVKSAINDAISCFLVNYLHAAFSLVLVGELEMGSRNDIFEHPSLRSIDRRLSPDSIEPDFNVLHSAL